MGWTFNNDCQTWTPLTPKINTSSSWTIPWTKRTKGWPHWLRKKSHHRNMSVMYIAHNLFHRGKHHRTVSLNAHYMVLFKNPRDVSQIMALAHQMYPQRTKYFLEAYTAALMFLWWLFFVNREATLWSVSSMRSSRMIKCFFLGSRVSKSGNPWWKSTPSTVPYKVW
jgi:hypothetical protein